MVRLELDLQKDVNGNAAAYFEKAKKIKKKIEGAESALKDNLRKLSLLEEQRQKQIKVNSEKLISKSRKKEWYEKFRWFISSEGILVIGGRDATSNEIVIKKHTAQNDIVFHTDMAGSPFFVVKKNDVEIGNATKQETADATCTFSRAWKLGLQTSDVFYANPSQVSKKTNSGEYMGKGAFMIYGKVEYISNKASLAVGITKDEKLMSGPVDAIKANCEKYLILVQGDEKASNIAKKINYKLGGRLDIDEIIRSLPAGDFRILA